MKDAMQRLRRSKNFSHPGTADARQPADLECFASCRGRIGANQQDDANRSQYPDGRHSTSQTAGCERHYRFRPSADDIEWASVAGGLCADPPAAKVRVFPATKAPVPMFRCRYGIVGRHAPQRGDIGVFGMRQRLTCRWCDRKQYADDQGAAQGMDIHARLHTSEIRPVVHRRTSSLAAPFLLAYSGLYVGT